MKRFLLLLLLVCPLCLSAQISSATSVTIAIAANDSFPGRIVYAMARDSSGNIWFGTDKGAACYMGPGGWFAYDTSDGLPAMRVLAIAVDDSNDVWFGTGKGAVHFDQDTTWTDISDSLSNGAVYSIAATTWKTNHRHLTFFGTSNGLYSYRSPANAFSHLTMATTSDSLPSNFIQAVHAVRYGQPDSLMRIWLGTGAGITRMRKF